MIQIRVIQVHAKTMSASTGITLKTKKKLGGLEPNAVVQSAALNEAVAAFDPNFSDWHDLGVIKSPITNICDRTPKSTKCCSIFRIHGLVPSTSHVLIPAATLGNGSRLVPPHKYLPTPCRRRP